MSQNTTKSILRDEEWRPIKGYEGLYEVSNYGRVRSLSRWKTNQYCEYKTESIILRHGVGRFGYCYVYLTNRVGAPSFKQVHRLVALAFLSDGGDRLYVNHKNGNKADNHIKNLEWCTKSENTKHAYDIGLKVKLTGENNPSHKLSLTQVREIRDKRKRGIPVMEIAATYNVHFSTIHRIINHKTWA